MIGWPRLLQKRLAAAAARRRISSPAVDEWPTAARRTRVELVGWRVDCCCIAEDARLLFLYPPEGELETHTFELSLRTPFRLRLDDAIANTIDPGGPRERLGPLLALYGSAVVDARVSDDGMLSLDFAGGASLVAEPHLVDEAWRLRGPRGEELICLPAGDGAVAFAGERGRGYS
jgi:hypothetical protein